MNHHATTLALLSVIVSGAWSCGASSPTPDRSADGGTPAVDGGRAGTDGGGPSADAGFGEASAGGDAATKISVTVAPAVAHVAPGLTAVFSAAVSGTTDMSVVWSVLEGASGGSIDAAGRYTAPATAGTYHVVAQSHAAANVTGTAIAAVAPVGSCAALPAAGTWDGASISPVTPPPNEPSYEFTGKPMAVVVDPFDPATVWLGTGDDGLFKSADCGATWTHVNTGMNGSSIDQSALWSMIVDPVNQGVIYVVGAYGAEGLWKSTNGGVDWVQLFPSTSAFAQLVPYDFIGNVSMDAANPLHLAVASHGVCNAPYTNGCLAESFDGGQTWPNIVGTPAAWGEKGGVQIVDATTWIWGTGDNFDGLYVTTDNGTTWTQACPSRAGDGDGELTILPLGRASDGAYYVSSVEGVLRSTDGVSWSLAWGQQNAPQVMGIALSPTTIYGAEGQSFYSAPIADYANWSAMPGPTALTSNDYAEFLAYDGAHKLLYASTWSGVYRFSIP